jgi:hypothetical protein
LRTVPAADGTRRPASGFFIWTPTRRRVIPGDIDEVVEAVSFVVELVDGKFEIDPAPTGNTWVWRVDEKIEGIRNRTVYLAVPLNGPVDYTDLVEVSPASMTPVAEPTNLWYAYVDELSARADLAREAAQASQDAAVDSQDSAAVSAGLADQSANRAGTDAFNAAASAAAALSSKNAASGYAQAAANDANDAEVAAMAAEASENAAAQSATSVASDRVRVEAVDLRQLIDAEIDGNGNLIFTRQDGLTVNVGRVISNLSVGIVETGP